MNVEFWSLTRIAGALMLLSVMVLATGFVVLGIQGTLAGLESAFRGVERAGRAASAHRTLEPFARLGVAVFLLGAGAFSAHLMEAGNRVLPLLAFGLLLVSVVLMAIEGSFHSRVTVWAGEQWAETGTVPPLYEPLRHWVNHSIQLAYLTFGFIAMGLYGWAILSTGVLPSWVGWATVGWNAVLLIPISLNVFGLPVLLFVTPILVGVMLLAA